MPRWKYCWLIFRLTYCLCFHLRVLYKLCCPNCALINDYCNSFDYSCDTFYEKLKNLSTSKKTTRFIRIHKNKQLITITVASCVFGKLFYRSYRLTNLRHRVLQLKPWTIFVDTVIFHLKYILPGINAIIFNELTYL